MLFVDVDSNNNGLLSFTCDRSKLGTTFKKNELFHQIRDRILELYDRQRITPVSILDEAQHLKGEVLQDLVMLLNFDMDTANKCIVIMTGLPSLNVTLSRAILDPLRQRIISNYQIVEIEADEVENYIEMKLRLLDLVNLCLQKKQLLR